MNTKHVIEALDSMTPEQRAEMEAHVSPTAKNEPSGEWYFKTVPTSCGSCHRIGNQKMFLADNCLCLYDDNKRVEEPSKNKGIAAEVCAAMNQHEKLKADNEKLQAEVERLRKHLRIYAGHYFNKPQPTTEPKGQKEV